MSIFHLSSAFSVMRTAFKEWAVVVDALARGTQILILRKGGIAEGRGGFHVDHERFWLFPTQFHQQRGQVVPAAQARFDELAPHFPPSDRVRLQWYAEVIEWRRLDQLAQALALRGQHVWRDEVIEERFDWGRDDAIFALALRVWRCPAVVELPMRAEYRGCKSWVELDADLPISDAKPVLDDAAFQAMLRGFRAALPPASHSTGKTQLSSTEGNEDNKEPTS